MAYADGAVNIAATSTTYSIGSAITDDGRYMLVLDLNAMAVNDILEVWAETKCRSSSTARVAMVGYYSDPQIEQVMYSNPVPISTTEEVTFKVKQTSGTAIGSTDYSILRM